MMIWELSEDTTDSALVTTIYDGLNGSEKVSPAG
jgi:hypothetical protein